MSGIHTAIIGMLTDIEAIGKDRECTQGARFKFRGIDDVYNAIHPLLSTHKVFPTAKILEKQFEERESKSGGVLRFSILTVAYTFWHEDGSNVVTEVVGEAMDSGDKSCNKAMSVAYKYALFQLLCIPTEVVDPDEERHEPAPAKAKAVQKEVEKSYTILTGEQMAYVAEATTEINNAATEQALRTLGEVIRTKPEPIQNALRPLFMAKLNLLKSSAAQ